MKSTLVAMTIAIAMVVPARVEARAPAAEPAPGEADPLEVAKQRHLAAATKYDTADYAGAIEAWQDAYDQLPRTADANPYRALILFNIAAAREKLFELRGDVAELKAAKILLEKFDGAIDEIYADAPEEGAAEREHVREKIARIDARIAEASKPPEPAPEPQPAASEPTPVAPADADTPPRRATPGRGLIIGGAVALGLGVAAGAGLIASALVGRKSNSLGGLADTDLVGRQERFDRGRSANAGAIASAAIGVVALATGVALVVVGSKRRARSVAWQPLLERGTAGLGLSGRF
jgi:hypothetical protein